MKILLMNTRKAELRWRENSRVTPIFGGPATRLFALLSSFIFVAAAGAQALSPVNEGNYAATVASAKGKVVLVNFWATWCVPCRKEMPELAKMAARLESRGFAFVAISGDDAEAEGQVKTFLQSSGLKGTAYIRKAKDDDKFIGLVDPKWNGALPALFLYDRKGVKVKAWYGETSPAEVEAEVNKRL